MRLYSEGVSFRGWAKSFLRSLHDQPLKRWLNFHSGDHNVTRNRLFRPVYYQQVATENTYAAHAVAATVNQAGEGIWLST